MTSAGRAFAYELHRSEAAELARAGDYDSAARILEELDGDDPETLDLLAKVHAQRGDLAAAEAAWRRVLSRSPDNSSAIAGTRLIAEITSGKRRRRPLPVLAVGAAAAVALVLAGAGVLITGLPQGDSASDARSTASPQVTEPAVDADLREQAEQREQAEAQRLRGRLQVLMGELAGPGVRLEQREGEIRVVFDDGLFLAGGSELSANGQRELVRWGQRLRGKDVHVTVLGHGVVVEGGPETGGSAVAVARAAAAALTLAGVAGRPLTSFTVMAADQSASPHAGTSPDARARNRTVSLLVTPANP